VHVHANQYQFQDGAVRLQLLSAHNMLECNAGSTPLQPGFHLVNGDKPTTDAERQAVVDCINTTFGFTHEYTYADAVRQMASTVQGINWFASQCSPGLRCSVSLVVTASHAPSVKAVKAVKQIPRYCQKKRQGGLTYRRHRSYARHEFSRQEYSSDASFADHVDNSKSQGGVVGRLDGNAAHYFTSQKAPPCARMRLRQLHALRVRVWI
jgi:hypothetical protein